MNRGELRRGGTAIFILAIAILIVAALSTAAKSPSVPASSANMPPQWVGESTKFTIPVNKPFVIALDSFFKDPEGQPLTFIATASENLVVEVKENTLTITPEPGFKGERMITVVASDGSQIASKRIRLEVGGSADEQQAPVLPVFQTSEQQPAVQPPALQLPVFATQETNAVVDPAVEEALKTESEVKVIIVLKNSLPSLSASSKEERKQALETIRSDVKALRQQLIGGFSVSGAGIHVLRQYDTLGAVGMSITQQGLDTLKASPLVDSIVLNRKFTASLNDSIPLIGATAVWGIVTPNGTNLTGAGETICIIDTGADLNHSAFANKIVGGYDFINNDTSPQDDSANSHGTHTAGIASANASFIHGVAPDANLVPVKVCDASNNCDGMAILAGIDYCNNNAAAFGISVISASLGDNSQYNSTACPTFFDSLFNVSASLGIIPVFASGNNGYTNGISYPACSPTVISVGSSSKSDTLDSFTNRGAGMPDVLAPGSGITSSIIGGGTGSLSGTSMATPHVSGAIALIQQNEKSRGRPALTISQMKQLFQTTGVDVSGYKRINVLAAVQERNVNISIGIMDTITGCPVTINASTVLANDVSSTGTCITVNASNLTFDCQGHTITYGTAGGIISFGVNITGTFSAGISNVTVQNCNIQKTSSGGGNNFGIEMRYTTGSIMTKNNISTFDGANNDGIELYASTGNSITSSIIYTNGTASNNWGLYIQSSSSNNVIANNTVYTNGSGANMGVFITSSNSNNLSQNTFVTRGPTGTNYGILLSFANLNIMSDNSIFTTDGSDNYGIFVRGSTNNTLRNNTISTNGTSANHGILLNGSNNNFLVANNVSTQGSASYGLYITISNSSQVNQTFLNNPAQWIYLDAGTINNFTNTTFATGYGSINLPNTAQFNGTQDVTRAKLNITANKAFLNSSNLAFLNTTAIITLNNLTYVTPRPLVDWNDTGNYQNCTSDICTQLSYTGNTYVFNVSHFTSYSTSDASTTVNITGCSAGPVLVNQSSTLTQNLSTNTSCLQINADNLLLDCNGSIIKYGINGSLGVYGIFSGSHINVTVQNCIIEGTNVSSSWSQAINFTGTNYSVIANNTIHINGSRYADGIMFRGSKGNIVYTNNITGVCNGTGTIYCNGVELFGFNYPDYNNNISGNIINFNTTSTGSHVHGIWDDGHTNNTFASNNNITIRTSSSYAVGIYSSATCYGGTYANNLMNVKGNGGVYGALITASQNYQINNNTISSISDANNAFGVFFNQANNNNVSNNTVLVNGTATTAAVYISDVNGIVVNGNVLIAGATNTNGNAEGVELQSSAGISGRYNLIYDNLINTTGNGADYGIRIYNGASYNNITNNTITAGTNGSNNHGIYSFLYSVENRIERNRIITNGTNCQGIFFDFLSANSTVIGNNITANGNGSYGITLFRANFSSFSNNTLDSCNSWINSTYSSNNFTNTTFVMHDGSINIPSTVRINNTQIMTGQLNITANRAFLNSSNLSFFNTTGIIALYGLSYLNPHLRVDWADIGAYVDCPTDVCTRLSYTGGTLVFNVTHFTSYSSSETVNITFGPYIINITTNLTGNVTSNSTGVIINGSNMVLDCAGNYIIYDINGSNNSFGILAQQVTNITVINCILLDVNETGGNNLGINFTEINNSAVQNTEINTNGTHNSTGVWLYSITNTTLLNLTVRAHGDSGENYGIALMQSSSNNILNSSITTNGTINDYGIYLMISPYSQYNIISGNTITAGQDSTGNYNYGIFLNQFAYYNNVTNNVINTWGNSYNYGIILDESYNRIEWNRIYPAGAGSNNHGMYVVAANYNSINNNTLQTFGATGSSYGMYFVSSANNSVINNSILTINGNSYNTGIQLTDSQYNNFTLNRISTNGIDSPGIAFSSGSNNNSFFATTFNMTGQQWVTAMPGTYNNLTNTTFENTQGTMNFPGLISVNGSVEITKANMNMTGWMAYVNSTNLSFMNTTGIIKFRGATMMIAPRPEVSWDDGLTYTLCPNNVCTELSFTGGDYVFNVSHYTKFTISEGAAPITGCALGPVQINRSAYLINDISSSGNCINITNSSLEFDCRGFTIRYDTGGADNMYGIQGQNLANVIIKDCNVFDPTPLGIGGFGIYLSNINYSDILNNTVTTNSTDGGYGIYMVSTGSEVNTHDNSIRNNTIRTMGYTNNPGILLYNYVSNVNITGNKVTAVNGTAIYMYQSMAGHRVIGNNITIPQYQYGDGIYNDGPSVVIEDNRVNFGGPSSTTRGVYVSSGAINNTIRYNTIESTQRYNPIGILLDSGTRNTTVDSNNITLLIARDGYGITVAYQNNTVTNNKITITGNITAIGIYVLNNARNVSVKYNTINVTRPDGLPGMLSVSSRGIAVTSAFSSNFTGNNITVNGSTKNYGIYLVSNVENHTFSDNNIWVNGEFNYNHGIHINGTRKNTFINTEIHTNGTMQNYGISLDSTVDTVFINTRIYTAETVGETSPGISILSSNNTAFTATVLNNTVSWINTSYTTFNNFTNTTFARNNGSIVLGNAQINGTKDITLSTVMTGYNYAYLNSSYAPGLNTTGTITFNNINQTIPVLLADFEDDYSYTTCPSAVCTPVSYSGGAYIFTTTHFTSFTLTDAAITQCGASIMASSNLSNDISSNSSCLTIYGDNLVLDCKGYEIRFNGNGGDYTTGITVFNRTNITIKNCLIRDINSSGQTATAINLTLTRDSKILNNTIQLNGSSGGYGIYDYSGSNNALIANNTITGMTGSSLYGIMPYNSNNSIIINNTIILNGSSNIIGMFTSGALNTTIAYNYVSSTATVLDAKGLTIPYSMLSLIENNTFEVKGANASGYGIYAYTPNTTIAHNTIIVSGGANNTGVKIDNFPDLTGTNLTGNTISVQCDDCYGLRVGLGSRLIYNNVTATGYHTYGIYGETAQASIDNTLLNDTTNWVITTNSATVLNLTNTTFAKPYGQIYYPRLVQLSAEKNINSSRLAISSLYAFVNSTNITALNTTAVITLNGVTFIDPKPIVSWADDGGYENCPANICTELSYSGGNYVFNVSHFTSYMTAEGFVNITGCPVTINESSTLNASITSNTTCVTIGADNIILDCNGNTISYNALGDNDTAGISAQNRNNVTIQNCIIRDINSSGRGGGAINFTSTNNSLIQNNVITINETLGYGVLLILKSYYNQINSNTITTTGTANDGIFLFSTAASNNITRNTITAQGTFAEYGFDIQSTSDNNTFSHNNISTTGDTSYGIYSTGSKGNLFATTLLNDTSEWVYNDVSSITNITNTTFAMPDGSINLPNKVTLSTSLDVSKAKLNITANRAFLNSSDLTPLNTTGIITLKGLTYLDPIPKVDWNNTGNYVNCPADVCTELSFTGGVYVFNVSHFTSYSSSENVTVITSCPATINTSATIEQNITANTSCIVFGADNVTLDCNGNTIFYNALGGDYDSGITASGRNNITIMDCIIRDINSSGSTVNAINFTRTNNSAIINNTIIANGTDHNHGIELRQNSYYNQISYNSITTIGPSNDNYGISLFSSVSGNIINGNTIRTSGLIAEYGINVMSSSNDNIFTNNNITTTGDTSYGIYLSLSTGNSFNNTLLNNTSEWLFNGIGTETNITNTTFEGPSGSINLPNRVELLTTLDVSKARLNVTYNKAFLDSNNLPALNTTGIITLYEINFTSPLPSVDWADTGSYLHCPPGICTELGYNAGTYRYIVTHFTSYSTAWDSNITNSTIIDSNITNCTIINSTIINSSKSNCTIINSYIINSTNNNTVIIDTNETNSRDNDTFVDDSIILDSTKLGSNINNSNITNSTIIDSNITNSTVVHSNETNSTNINATVDHSIIINSIKINTIINNSNITNTTLIGTIVINSTVNNSNLTNCTVTNSTLGFGVVNSSCNYTNYIQPSPTPTPPGPGPQPGGSGGGGGGGVAWRRNITSTMPIIPCVENWNCEEWSNCEVNAQVRICVDLNKCNSSRYVPQTARACGPERILGAEPKQTEPEKEQPADVPVQPQAQVIANKERQSALAYCTAMPTFIDGTLILLAVLALVSLLIGMQNRAKMPWRIAIDTIMAISLVLTLWHYSLCKEFLPMQTIAFIVIVTVIIIMWLADYFKSKRKTVLEPGFESTAPVLPELPEAPYESPKAPAEEEIIEPVMPEKKAKKGKKAPAVEEIPELPPEPVVIPPAPAVPRKFEPLEFADQDIIEPVMPEKKGKKAPAVKIAPPARMSPEMDAVMALVKRSEKTLSRVNKTLGKMKKKRK